MFTDPNAGSDLQVILQTCFLFACVFTLGALILGVLAAAQPTGRYEYAAFGLIAASAAVSHWTLWVRVTRASRAARQSHA